MEKGKERKKNNNRSKSKGKRNFIFKDKSRCRIILVSLIFIYNFHFVSYKKSIKKIVSFYVVLKNFMKMYLTGKPLQFFSFCYFQRLQSIIIIVSTPFDMMDDLQIYDVLLSYLFFFAIFFLLFFQLNNCFILFY